MLPVVLCLQTSNLYLERKHGCKWPQDAQRMSSSSSVGNNASGMMGRGLSCLRLLLPVCPGMRRFFLSTAAGRTDEQVHRLCEQGHLDTAVDVLMSMGKEKDGTSTTVPSVKVYRGLLKLCTKRKALDQAKKVYVHLAVHNMQSTMHLGDSVVKTLVTCGGLADAVDVFNRLVHRSVVSWTAVISGYASAGQGQAALKMYDRMLEEGGVKPNGYTFIAALKACTTLSNLTEGKRIHAQVVEHGFGADVFVTTCLVDMYAKCGSVADAQLVFDGLPHRDVVLWNAMLAGHVQQGRADEAVQLYQRMQKEGVATNARTFVSVLQACGMLAHHTTSVGVARVGVGVGRQSTNKQQQQEQQEAALERGRAVHADAKRNGHECDVFVRCALITMYGRCVSIADAQSVFGTMALPNVVLWNAMLGAYNQVGQPEEALSLYQRMSFEKGVSADVRTFMAAIQACGMLADKGRKQEALAVGKTVHRDIQSSSSSKGVSAASFVANSLMGMYGKCGSIVDARKVFDEMPERNEISWNVILGTYVQQGDADMALELYTAMLDDGCVPDDRTFVSMAQACGVLAELERVDLDGVTNMMSTRFLHQGKLIHAYAQTRGYVYVSDDMFVGNSLVSMYGKCGSLLDAQTAFDALSHRTVVAWTALLAAYTQQRQAEQAFQLYHQMQRECVTANDRTLVTMLQACGMLAEAEEEVAVHGRATRVKALLTGKALHASARRLGHEADVFVGSTLVSMYGKCGSLLDAQIVFRGLSEPNVVSWNGMLAACALQGLGEQAVQLYGEMLEQGVSPNDRTFVSALQACGTLADTENEFPLPLGGAGQSCTLDSSLSKVKEIHMAAWRKGYGTDVYIGSTLITTYARCGSMEDSQHVFHAISHRSLVSWNAMLSAYVEQQEGDKALLLYRQMLEKKEKTPNEVTWLNVLQACGSTGSLDVCRQIHQAAVDAAGGFTLLVANSLIHAYGRCSSMEEAQHVFDTVRWPDVVSWSALIAGHARQGNYVASLKCYDAMLSAGVKPNGVTFLSILSACNHAGLVEEGVEYFESMSTVHGISPEIEHYVSMVDLLGRAGFFDAVQQLLSSMPMQQNLLLCLCLLGACQKHGKVELAKQAFDCAVRLQPRDGAAYVLMLNIYVEAGLWDDARKVNDLRHQAGALKKPGQCWIEFNRESHVFLAGTDSLQEDLCGLLGTVCVELLEEG